MVREGVGIVRMESCCTALVSVDYNIFVDVVRVRGEGTYFNVSRHFQTLSSPPMHNQPHMHPRPSELQLAGRGLNCSEERGGDGSAMVGRVVDGMGSCGVGKRWTLLRMEGFIDALCQEGVV